MKIAQIALTAFAAMLMSVHAHAQTTVVTKTVIKDGKVLLDFGHGKKFLVKNVIFFDELDYYLNYYLATVSNEQEVTVGIANMPRWDHKNRSMPLNRFSRNTNKRVNLILIGGPQLISLGGNCFEDCTAIRSIYIPETVQSLGGKAFKGCSFSSITIPKSVQSIGSYCFADNSALEEVIFEGNTRIADETVFLNCSPTLKIYVKKKYLKDYRAKYPYLTFEKAIHK